MKNKKIRNLIKKVEILLEEDEPLSILEKDMVLSYLRKIYELVKEEKKILNENHGSTGKVKSDATFKSQSKSSVVEKEVPFLNEKTTFVSQEEISSYNQDPAQSHSTISVPDNGKGNSPIATKYDDLFENASVRDLSDKLSEYPITDLSKAFSINDKLLAINELFGGDTHYFNETVETINRKLNFEEVKSYLTLHIIQRFNWMDEAKQDTARNFLKLVRRRFQHK